jgi:hypothetical protein
VESAVEEVNELGGVEGVVSEEVGEHERKGASEGGVRDDGSVQKTRE